MSGPVPDITSPPLPDGQGQVQGLSLTASVSLRPSAIAALEHYKQKDTSKVVVRFKSIGSAPIMKNNIFKVTAGNKYAAVVTFLRGQLGSKEGDPLFTYINAAFTPAPDDIVGNLYKCFGTEGHLIINYRSVKSGNDFMERQTFYASISANNGGEDVERDEMVRTVISKDTPLIA